MTARLRELRELMERATKGPWRAHDCGHNNYGGEDRTCGIVSEVEAPTPWSSKPLPLDVITSDSRDECSHPISKTDAALIVAAVNALPQLLAIAEAALKVDKQWHAVGTDAQEELRAALARLGEP